MMMNDDGDDDDDDDADNVVIVVANLVAVVDAYLPYRRSFSPPDVAQRVVASLPPPTCRLLRKCFSFTRRPLFFLYFV